MVTKPLRKASRRQKEAFWPAGRKLTVALRPEELMLAMQLGRVVTQTGTPLNPQDVLRIALARMAAEFQKISPTAMAAAEKNLL